MAGKRQHYVPRFLQRGFLAGPSGSPAGGERTWLHRLGAPARLVGIGDIGVEDWFYSRKGAPGETTLDDAITEFEKSFSRDVKNLRLAATGTEVDPAHAARTVVHLVTRTAHIRETLLTGMSSLMDEVEALFTDPARFGGMLGFASPTIGTAVSEAIRNSALELVPAGFPASFSERLLIFFMREFGDVVAAQMIAVLSPLLPTLFSGLAGRIRDGHNELLAKPLEDHGWVAILSTFVWSIEEGTDLILPDAVAVSRSGEGTLEALLFTGGSETALVLLPLAHDRMLVGRRDPAQTIDLSSFNANAAAACRGFFIGARSHDGDGLASTIGSGPARALAEAVSEAIAGAEQTGSLAPGDFAPAIPSEVREEQFSYQVRLHDFGDDVLAKEYADILQSVIGALSRDIPLHNLDGITIAADYDDALAKLDRGDPDLLPVASEALPYGAGVAMPVRVIREGEHKEHLVLAAGIAQGWTSDDPETRAACLHILVKMLAGIANSTRFGEATTFEPDEMARELHLAVARAPAIYWSAKQAAFVYPDEGAVYADLVIDSLDHARQAVATARARMTDPSDVNETFLAAYEIVSAALGHAADWLGHRDGLAPDLPFDGDDLPARLADRGLNRWIELFGRDLAVCYQQDGSLDLNVVTTLSRHVERIFWSLGVFCWPEEAGVRCTIAEQGLTPGKIGDLSALSDLGS